MRRRTPEEKEGRRKKKQEQKEEIAHLRAELNLIYARIGSARENACDKLGEYLEKVENRSPVAQINTAKTAYETRNKAVEKLKEERNAIERKARRLFPRDFNYLL